MRKLPEKSEEKTEGGSFDIAGNVLFVLMIFGFMFGLSTFSTIRYTWLMIAAGIGLGAVFVIHESRIQNPVIKVGLFRNSLAYSLSNTATFFKLFLGASFAISYLLSIYLQSVMGYYAADGGIDTYSSAAYNGGAVAVYGQTFGQNIAV